MLFSNTKGTRFEHSDHPFLRKCFQQRATKKRIHKWKKLWRHELPLDRSQFFFCNCFKLCTRGERYGMIQICAVIAHTGHTFFRHVCVCACASFFLHFFYGFNSMKYIVVRAGINLHSWLRDRYFSAEKIAAVGPPWYAINVSRCSLSATTTTPTSIVPPGKNHRLTPVLCRALFIP